MFKLTINSQKEGQFWIEKQTQSEVDEYLSWAAESKHWGSPQWVEEFPEQINITTNEQGVQHQTTVPAYQVVHPAEYEIIVEDITAQIAAEQAQIQAIKDAQTQAGLRLQAFPAQVDAAQDLMTLKEAIKQMVQDIALLLS